MTIMRTLIVVLVSLLIGCGSAVDVVSTPPLDAGYVGETDGLPSDAASSDARDVGGMPDDAPTDTPADTASACALLDNGVSTDGTLLSPCWSGEWQTLESDPAGVTAATPAVGAPWSSVLAFDDTHARRMYGTTSASGSIEATIVFTHPTDVSAWSGFDIDVSTTGIGAPAGQSLHVEVIDAAGHHTSAAYGTVLANKWSTLHVTWNPMFFDVSTVTMFQVTVDSIAYFDVYLREPRLTP